VVHARSHGLVAEEVDGEPDDDFEELVSTEFAEPLPWFTPLHLTLGAGLQNDIMQTSIGEHVRVANIHFVDEHLLNGVGLDPGGNRRKRL